MFRVLSHYFSVWLLSLLVFYSTGEVQKAGNRLPPEPLQADRLVLADLNFSIKTPGKDWIWHRTELGQVEGKKATVFTVDDPSDALRFIVLVWERETRRTSPINDTDWLLKGMQQGLAAGWTSATPQVSDSDVPLPGSMRFSSTAIGPEGDKQYLFGYGTQGKRMYYFMAYSLSPVEPQLFSEMVRSFRILNPNDNLAEPSGVWWYITSLLLVVFVTMVLEVGLAFGRRKSSRQASGPP